MPKRVKFEPKKRRKLFDKCKNIFKFKRDKKRSIYKEEDYPTLKDVWTGFFRDGKRRIDIVIVIADTKNTVHEMYKVNFLMNVLKIGLQLEVEPGVMVDHAHLLFVKVHAPETVLVNFANYYDMRPYFKETRLHFMRKKRTFYEMFFKGLTTTTEYEVDWIKMMRAQYNPVGFSNIERSQVVYQILSYVSFGEGEFHIGIAKLLKKQVFIDAYALHDGPYFFIKNQDTWIVNPRQILYYNWAGKNNLYKYQPLNFIQEYFGDRISMYFTFYSFYNSALVWASVVGFIVVALGILDATDHVIIDETCNDESIIICPLCRRFKTCPFKSLNQFCLTAIITNVIDNPYTPYYSLFVSLWAIFMIALWRRHEIYWAWLWELKLVDTVMPNFKFNFSEIGRSPTTGVFKTYESRKKRSVRILLTFIIVFIVILTVFFVIALMILFRYWLHMVLASESTILSDYYASAIYGVISVFIIFSLDEACRSMSYKLTDYENHYNGSTFQRSLIIKLYIFTFAFTFSMLIFFSYLKGAFYTYPSDPSRWYTLLGIGMITCSPFGCLDEVWILLSVTLIVKQIMLRLWYSFTRMRTDYNEGPEMNIRVPIWEREFRLKPADEASLTDKYRELVTQFASLTLFVAAFPLAPACALVANIWDIRHKAREFLCGSRRPLLPPSIGLGAWREILLAVAYATAITNGLTIAITTRTIQRHFYLKEHPSLEGFIMSTMSIFDVKDYLLETGPGSPHEQYVQYLQHKNVSHCYYTGSRYPPNHSQKYQLTGSHWYISYYELLFVVVFEHGVFLMVFLFHYIIPSVPRDVYEAQIIEERIKNVHRLKKRWIRPSDVPRFVE